MRRSDHAPGRWPGRPAGLAAMGALAALALLAAGCSGGASTTGHTGSGHVSSTDAAHVTITPANGTINADPSAGITVRATSGTLKNVTVHTSGTPVSGTLSPDGKVWHSQWTLDVSRSYTVTATTSGTGSKVAGMSTFRTLTPSRTFQTSIFEGYQATYGVGMPIMLTFSQPITDKAAVERSLQVTTSNPVVGAWYWDGNKALDFRPRDYWPAGTTVSFVGHLNGVRGGPGMYGSAMLTQSFNIGASLVAITNTASHHTQIYYNGRLRYNWPISTGQPGDDTANGSYLTIEKGNPVQMTGPGYSVSVPYSVRFTYSGDYYHDAWWSVGEQGFTNVSHGCVNLSPEHAQTYYNLAVPGDPITVIRSPVAGMWDDGFTEWFLSWPQYLQGSALHQAVEAGPNGSTFVDPATLPVSTATAPLWTSPLGNSAAG
jgi:lipoprotein-anchoring transpeptidase ErfK/SrfK